MTKVGEAAHENSRPRARTNREPTIGLSRSAIVRPSFAENKGAGMGDKGGKKDKEKNKQQQLTKQRQGEQKKHDKAPAKKPLAGTA
jgi:hypothetical protein